MKKIKIFISQSVNNIESDINDFLSEGKINIIGFHQTMNERSIMITILYVE